MKTWILQKPAIEQFAFEALLATSPSSVAWTVKGRSADVKIGDQVFLWRREGAGAGKMNGVVAEAFVGLAPTRGGDTPELDGVPAADRTVELRIVRIELKDRFQPIGSTTILSSSPPSSHRCWAAGSCI